MSAIAHETPLPSRVPDCALRVLEEGEWRLERAHALFAGRTIVVFALPGAFTPTCSSRHLPRYEELAPVLRAQGIEAVYCLSVNDPFVMAEWGRDQGLQEVQLLADGNGDFARAMGLLLDDSALGMGLRSRRYSMLVRDGDIEKLFIEADRAGDPYEVSDADTMLDYLAPQTPRPPRIAMFAKPGCPYCAAARRMLREHGLRFEQVELPDASRGRVLAAIGAQISSPQVYIDGHHIGGSDALRQYLDAQASRPRTA